ncbi:MAG: preprotein translocase subunit YajC [Pirellulaceae bacterium]
MNFNVSELLTHSFVLFAQNTGEAGTDASTGAPSDSLISQILGNPLNLVLISGILFVMLVLRPQQRQMKDLQAALKDLKKNDRVITSSGIHGTVVQANSDEATVSLRIDENSNTRIKINRDAIAKVVTEEKAKGGEKKA